MKILPVIIDARPAYLRRSGAPHSLLMSTVGLYTLLENVHHRLEEVTDEAATVVATFPADPEYADIVRRAGLLIDDVTSLDRFDEILSKLEPSDWMLMIDPRNLPIDRSGLRELVRDRDRSRAARHLVAMETSHQGTKEYVQLDGQGRVQRIQRYYDGVTWLQTRAVTASLIPVSAVRGFPSAALRDLMVLREALVTAGVVSRDIGLPAGVFDLNQEYGLVQLCECSIRDQMDHAPPAEFEVIAPGVWVGPGCKIDPTVRFHGPVILHESVRLEAYVAIIGPTVVGANSCIRRHAVLAQCLVAPGTVVPKHTTAQHCMLCGEEGSDSAPTGESPSPALGDRLLKRLQVVLPTQPFGRHQKKLRRDTYIAVKRLVEGVVALLGLIVLSPLLLSTASAIKLTSRGPVFFYHQREGKDGKPFRCCKFRTMVAGAHRQQRGLYRRSALDGPQFKLEHDPRITWLGRWLRMSNIDELPQLFNVVSGHMSLIGPRPSPFRENQICVPWREARLAVRPGITGLWQVCRQQRSAGDFHQWIHYDMLYVRHMSPWLDLKIVLATVLTLGGRWNVPVSWLIPARCLHEECPVPSLRPPVARALRPSPQHKLGPLQCRVINN